MGRIVGKLFGQFAPTRERVGYKGSLNAVGIALKDETNHAQNIEHLG